MIAHPDDLVRFALHRLDTLRAQIVRDRLATASWSLVDTIRSWFAPREQATECCPACCGTVA